MYFCVCNVRMYIVRVCTRTYIVCVYMHIHAHTQNMTWCSTSFVCIHTCTVCIHTCTVCIHTCTVCMYITYFMHACIYTYTHTYTHTHTHTHTYTHTEYGIMHHQLCAYTHTLYAWILHIHACMHAYIHTYIHTHTHTYTHTEYGIMHHQLNPMESVDIFDDVPVEEVLFPFFFCLGGFFLSKNVFSRG